MGKPLDWHIQLQKLAVIIKDDMALMISVCDTMTPEGFSCIVLETPKPQKNKPVLEVGNMLFDNHSHKIVGIYKTEQEAVKAGEDYAEAWRNGKTLDELLKAACKCPELPEIGSIAGPEDFPGDDFSLPSPEDFSDILPSPESIIEDAFRKAGLVAGRKNRESK